MYKSVVMLVIVIKLYNNKMSKYFYRNGCYFASFRYLVALGASYLTVVEISSKLIRQHIAERFCISAGYDSDKLIAVFTVDSQDASLDVQACHRHHARSHGSVEGEVCTV